MNSLLYIPAHHLGDRTNAVRMTHRIGAHTCVYAFVTFQVPLKIMPLRFWHESSLLKAESYKCANEI